MTVTRTDADRAATGAKWLDEVKPGWAALIDKDTLDILDARRCILGQVFAAEAQAERRSGYNYAMDTYPTLSSRGCSYGFCCSAGTIHDAWFAEIDKRII